MDKYLIMTNFIVMIIGILIGFYLEGLRKQHQFDKVSKTKLHIMYLETQYNIKIAKELYDCYSIKNSIQINLKRLDMSTAKIAFEDENIFRLLTPNKISLIRAYLEEAQSVNKFNDSYNEYLGDTNYKVTENGEKYREKIVDLASSFLATGYVVQQEFLEFFNEDIYDQAELEKIEKMIKKAKQKVLSGQFSIRNK